MKDDSPIFDPSAAMWAQTVIIQSILVQLIETRTFTVAQTEHVFALAYARTKKQRELAPDAEKLIQHIHDNLTWDAFYQWEAQQPKTGQ